MSTKKKLLLFTKEIMSENIKSGNKPLITLYFIRHGNATNNEGITSTDSELTDYGISQAKEAHNKLKDIKFDAIYCSSLARTIQTSHYALTNKNIYLDDRLIEKTYSICEQRKDKMDLVKYTHALKNNNYLFNNVSNDYVFKKETNKELFIRVITFFNYIITLHKSGGTILIISHYSWLDTFFKLITGQSNEFDNCEIKIIKLNF
jgi:broad specificity phosphatase PhoE